MAIELVDALAEFPQLLQRGQCPIEDVVADDFGWLVRTASAFAAA